MADKHPDYWAIKSAYQQFKLNQIANEQQLRDVLVSRGLKPNVHYTLNDEHESVTETPSP